VPSPWVTRPGPSRRLRASFDSNTSSSICMFPIDARLITVAVSIKLRAENGAKFAGSPIGQILRQVGPITIKLSHGDILEASQVDCCCVCSTMRDRWFLATMSFPWLSLSCFAHCHSIHTSHSRLTIHRDRLPSLKTLSQSQSQSRCPNGQDFDPFYGFPLLLFPRLIDVHVHFLSISRGWSYACPPIFRVVWVCFSYVRRNFCVGRPFNRIPPLF